MSKSEQHVSKSSERPPAAPPAPEAEPELWEQLGNTGYAEHLQNTSDVADSPSGDAATGGLGGILGTLNLAGGVEAASNAMPTIAGTMERAREIIADVPLNHLQPMPIGMPLAGPGIELAQRAGEGLRQGVQGGIETAQGLRPAIADSVQRLAENSPRGIADHIAGPIPGPDFPTMLGIAETAGDTLQQGVGYGLDMWHAAREFFPEAAADARDIHLPNLLADTYVPLYRSRRLGLERRASSQDNQAEMLEATRNIPNQDIIYEQLARNLAYGRSDPAQLALWGYGPPEVAIPWNPITGMYAVAVRPRADLDESEKNAIQAMHQQDLRPVLAFRGSADAVDWADDLVLEYIGAFQFSAHRSEIAGALADLAKDGPVDTVGHSLGGALAQLAATVGPVNRIVTFQAPGISTAHLDAVKDGPEATHHRAANDVVAWAGDRHVEGDAYVHTTTENIPGYSHIQFQLTALNDLRAKHGAAPEIPGIYDGSVFSDPSPEVGGDTAPISELDPKLVERYERRRDSGLLAKLVDVHRPAAAEEPGGRPGSGFEQARQGVSESARRGFGNVARFDGQAADLVHDYTGYRPGSLGESVAKAFNLITQGEGLGTTTIEMSEFVRLNGEYEERVRNEVRAADPAEVPRIIERLKREVKENESISDELKRLLGTNIEWAASTP